MNHRLRVGADEPTVIRLRSKRSPCDRHGGLSYDEGSWVGGSSTSIWTESSRATASRLLPPASRCYTDTA